MSACIVTGSAAGNGLAIARRLLKDGHYVIGVDRSVTPIEAASMSIVVDILGAEKIEFEFSEAVAFAERAFYFVKNAGVSSYRPMEYCKIGRSLKTTCVPISPVPTRDARSWE